MSENAARGFFFPCDPKTKEAGGGGRTCLFLRAKCKRVRPSARPCLSIQTPFHTRQNKGGWRGSGVVRCGKSE